MKPYAQVFKQNMRFPLTVFFIVFREGCGTERGSCSVAMDFILAGKHLEVQLMPSYLLPSNIINTQILPLEAFETPIKQHMTHCTPHFGLDTTYRYDPLAFGFKREPCS
jgi:hypothetical protein